MFCVWEFKDVDEVDLREELFSFILMELEVLLGSLGFEFLLSIIEDFDSRLLAIELVLFKLLELVFESLLSISSLNVKSATSLKEFVFLLTCINFNCLKSGCATSGGILILYELLLIRGLVLFLDVTSDGDSVLTSFMSRSNLFGVFL